MRGASKIGRNYSGTLSKQIGTSMLKKNKLRVSAVAVLAVAGLAFGAVAASADPALNTFKPVNGVGSDTTQDVMNGVAFSSASIASYDATGSAQIKTTATGPLFNRPNGSGSGVIALSAASNTGTQSQFPAGSGNSISGQVDFARSSGGPNATAYPGTALTFIPYARDAVTFAVNAASDFPRDIPLGTASQDSISPAPFTLRNIYRCTVLTYPDSEFADVAITPLLPQSGSGTRNFFLNSIGFAGSNPSGFGTCVKSTFGSSSALVQENDGTAVNTAGDIVPFSVAQFISQGNYKSLPTPVDERRGQVVLGSINGAKPYVLGTNGIEINNLIPTTRLVYNVVASSRLAEAGIASAFVGTGSSVCAAQSTIRAYGFNTIGTLCGNTIAYKQGFRFV